jgi:hypothetical protein
MNCILATISQEIILFSFARPNELIEVDSCDFPEYYRTSGVHLCPVEIQRRHNLRTEAPPKPAQLSSVSFRENVSLKIPMQATALSCGCRRSLPASHRMWSMIASFENRWNVPKWEIIFDKYDGSSTNTSKNRTVASITSRWSRPHFQTQPWASMNQICNGSICKNPKCWRKLHFFCWW